MTNSKTIRAILILCVLALSATAQQPQQQTITGKVVSVANGDTLAVLDAEKRQHKVKLDGIAAPENTQAFGDKARQSLSDLVRGKTVTVTSSKATRNGWIIGKVMLDGKDINLEQIRARLCLVLPQVRR